MIGGNRSSLLFLRDVVDGAQAASRYGPDASSAVGTENKVSGSLHSIKIT